MSDYWTSRDENEILALLRRGLTESDPAPIDLAEFAKAAISWRNIDAELAELDFDSTEVDDKVGVRSTGTARMVSFQSGQWIIDIEYDENTGRLIGHITPTAHYSVELHTGGALFTTSSDELGRFDADGVEAGPMSLVLRLDGGPVIKTPWTVL